MNLFVSVNTHQGGECFSIESKGKQCAFINLSASLVAECIPLKEWSQSTINNVLLQGDCMYINALNNGLFGINPGLELTSIDNLPRFIDLSCNMNMLSFEFIDATVNNINSKALFKRRTFHVPNAIQTIVNDMINLIIYCLNCIRHMKSSTFELGLTNPCIACRILNSTFN